MQNFVMFMKKKLKINMLKIKNVQEHTELPHIAFVI